MKDKIPILDDKYFRDKARRDEFDDFDVQFLPISRENQTLYLKYSVNLLAREYFRIDSMDASTFEHQLDQKLLLYPEGECPITSFSKKQKKPMLVGDILNWVNFVRLAVTIITAWFALLLLHIVGIG